MRAIKAARYAPVADQIIFDNRDVGRDGMAVHSAACREANRAFSRAFQGIGDDRTVQAFIRCIARERFADRHFNFWIGITTRAAARTA